MQFLTLSIGLILGVLLSILAVLAGKQFSAYINSEKKPIENKKMAKIIKNIDPIEEFLK